MDEQDHFVAEVNAFLATSGMAITSFGQQAVGDKHFVRRLRDGRGVTLATVGKVRRFIEQRRRPDAGPAPAVSTPKPRPLAPAEAA